LSPPEYALDYIEKFDLVRIGMSKWYECSPVAEGSLIHQKHTFIKRTRND